MDYVTCGKLAKEISHLLATWCFDILRTTAAPIQRSGVPYEERNNVICDKEIVLDQSVITNA
jgi:hypothetical protein